jgi:hypothetical protein
MDLCNVKISYLLNFDDGRNCPEYKTYSQEQEECNSCLSKKCVYHYHVP